MVFSSADAGVNVGAEAAPALTSANEAALWARAATATRARLAATSRCLSMTILDEG
jgi:hypothetical protein